MDDPKPKRRWYQFSLRTLLVAVLALSLPLGWVSWELEKTRREQAAIAEYGQYDAFISYHQMSGPSWMVQRFRKIRAVDFSMNPFGATRIAEVKLRPLKRMTNLVEVTLWNTTVDDAGLANLHGLSHLKSLNLGLTQVTDAGLVHLQDLTSLEVLDLGDTQVTDAGLAHLRQLTNLKQLDLSDTQVSADGVAKLQQALPDCEIVHY